MSAGNVPAKDIAARINAAHAEAIEHATSAIECARRAGALLIEAKAACGHGEWLPWLKENVTFSERTAQAYMRLSRNPQPVADLGIKGALESLAVPRKEGLREALDTDLREWMDRNAERRTGRPPVSEWTDEDAIACAQGIREFDEVMHRHGVCSMEDCTVCDAEDDYLDDDGTEPPPQGTRDFFDLYEGPFCAFDAEHGLEWLLSKFIFQIGLEPTTVGAMLKFSLIDYRDIPLLRLVSYDDLRTAAEKLIPFATGKAAIPCEMTDIKQIKKIKAVVSYVQRMAETLVGGILTEFDHREAIDDETYRAEYEDVRRRFIDKANEFADEAAQKVASTQGGADMREAAE